MIKPRYLNSNQPYCWSFPNGFPIYTSIHGTYVYIYVYYMLDTVYNGDCHIFPPFFVDGLNY